MRRMGIHDFCDKIVICVDGTRDHWRVLTFITDSHDTYFTWTFKKWCVNRTKWDAARCVYEVIEYRKEELFIICKLKIYMCLSYTFQSLLFYCTLLCFLIFLLSFKVKNLEVDRPPCCGEVLIRDIIRLHTDL